MIKGHFTSNKDKKELKEELFYYFLRILFFVFLYLGYKYYIDDSHVSSNIMIEQYHMFGGKEDINQFLKDKSVK